MSVWRVKLTKNHIWLGVCEPLKLTIQADTFADLMEDIGLALGAISETYEMVCRKCGLIDCGCNIEEWAELYDPRLE